MAISIGDAKTKENTCWNAFRDSLGRLYFVKKQCENCADIVGAMQNMATKVPAYFLQDPWNGEKP